MKRKKSRGNRNVISPTASMDMGSFARHQTQSFFGISIEGVSKPRKRRKKKK